MVVRNFYWQFNSYRMSFVGTNYTGILGHLQRNDADLWSFPWYPLEERIKNFDITAQPAVQLRQLYLKKVKKPFHLTVTGSNRVLYRVFPKIGPGACIRFGNFGDFTFGPNSGPGATIRKMHYISSSAIFFKKAGIFVNVKFQNIFSVLM